MSTASRRINLLLVVALVLTMAASQSRAWDPPDGRMDPNRPDLANRLDLAEEPATPTTLLPQAHGYIIQNGISILYNDGYWFAAQMLRESQQELLNGVRYADVYLGRQVAILNLCVFLILDTECSEVYRTHDWFRAADNHYFNPDTGQGLNSSGLKDEGTLIAAGGTAVLDLIIFLTRGYILPFYFRVDIQPVDIEDISTSALQMFDEEYAHALNAYFEISAPSCGRSGDDHLVLCQDIRGRQGPALAMFYLGWASHLMQDQTVVHHTFDEVQGNHGDYEGAADGKGTSPIAHGEQRGIYEADLAQRARDLVYFYLGKDLPLRICNVDSQPIARRCFASYANYMSHDPKILDAAETGDYSNVQVAIPFAQNLQAGLYAAFLTDIGLRPIHMSAVIAAL